MEIAICIATHKRPKLLKQLLAGLQAQTFVKMQEPEVHLIVIDNDAFGSSEAVCCSVDLRWTLSYRVEPRRGIAQARNCALRHTGSADYIVFIDDDEIPAPDWLEELLLAGLRYKADVVSGPVLPLLPADAPSWMRRGGFFDSPSFTTGQVIETCATNNTLVTRAVIDRVPNFREHFQLSGVDDFYFFCQVHRAGFKLVWCNEAIVREAVTPDRANLKWLLLRAFRGGNGAVLVEFALDQSLFIRVQRFGKACVRLVQGAFGVVLSLFGGKVALVRSMRRVSLGAGMLAALFGFIYQSHRVTTGE